MTEQTIRELYRAGLQPAPLDDAAEAELVAALIEGPAAEREAGLARLASHPQGPALARIIQAMAPESAALSAALRARRQPQRSRPLLVALAASAAAVALLVAGLRSSPVETPPVGDDRILVASFEGAEDRAPPASDELSIFRGDFDS
jgi:hypothetical protein